MEKDSSKHYFEYIYGINSVLSLLKVNMGRRKIFEIFIDKKRLEEPKTAVIKKIAEEKGIKIFYDFKNIRENSPSLSDEKNQAVCAKVSNYSYHDIELFLKDSIVKNSKFLLLDGITDIGNFGAIIRNSRAFGFEGIIIGKHRSVSVNKDVSRISAGTLEETRIFMATNLVNCINYLKKSGYWIYAACSGDSKDIILLNEARFSFPMVLVLGSEHKGVSRLVTENCDFLVRIEIEKEVDSLNVSTASGIIMYEADKQQKELKN